MREIFAFEIRNPAQGINNFANDWNPESSPWNLESGIPSVEFRVQDRLKLHYMGRLAPQSWEPTMNFLDQFKFLGNCPPIPSLR